MTKRKGRRGKPKGRSRPKAIREHRRRARWRRFLSQGTMPCKIVYFTSGLPEGIEPVTVVTDA